MRTYELEGKNLEKYFESDVKILELVKNNKIKEIIVTVDDENKTVLWESSDISEVDDYEGVCQFFSNIETEVGK